MRNIIGERFTNYVVISLSHEDSHKNWYYVCQCDCGTQCTVSGKSLIYGRSKGCVACRPAKVSASLKGKPSSLKGKEQSHIPDLSGQKFNDLFVLHRKHRSNKGEWVYTCRCVCGRETDVRSSRIRNGEIKRCKYCGIKHMTQTKREQARLLKDKKTPYTPDFSPQLRREIRQRDRGICVLCGKRPPKLAGHGLHVHHIDWNKENCDLLNLISLCNKCHRNMGIPKDKESWIVYWQNYMKERYSND